MLEDFENLKKYFQEYISVQIDLIRLRSAENISRILSRTANFAIIGYLLFFIFLFISLSAGFYLSARFGSHELGFLSVGVFYIFLLTIFMSIRKKIVERPIIQAIVKMFFSENDNNK